MSLILVFAYGGGLSRPHTHDPCVVPSCTYYTFFLLKFELSFFKTSIPRFW